MTSSRLIQYMTKSILCGRILAVSCLYCLLLWSSTAFAIETADEEFLDREAGILDRPWKINLVRLATRDYLRYKAQVKTGLPSYDQLVEVSRQAPQVLFDRLTGTPAPTKSESRRTTPDPEPRRTSPDPAPSTTSAPPAPASAPAPAPAPEPTPPPAPPTGFNPDPAPPTTPPFVPPWSSPPTS